MLLGLTSRWTTPRWWACCSASATAATSAAATAGAGPVVADRLGQGAALDELRHDEAREVGGTADVEDGDDVRVVEAGGGAGLGEVGVGVLRTGDEVRVRHLDRHRALQLLVAGQVDAAEAALAQEPLDAVTADVRRQQGSGDRYGGDELPFTLRRGPQRVGAIVHGASGAETIVAFSPADHSRPEDPLP